MKPTIVAYDGIAVIVNSANPIKGLTKKQVEQIFTGEVTDWSAVGGSGGKISIYTRNTSSGTYSDFKELAMKKRDYAALAEDGGQRADRRGSGQERERRSVTLVSPTTRRPASRSMPIDGVMPSVQTVSGKPIPMRDRPSITPTASRADLRSSLSISPSVPPGRKSSTRSALFRLSSSNSGAVGRLG